MASWGLSVQKTVPTSTATCSRSADEKLRAIFHHFDDNHDGYLSYQELRRLQLQTSGDDLDGPTFCALCEEFKCRSQRGLTLAALRATYADGDGIDGGGEGSVSIEEDYDKIFPDGEEEEDNEDGGQESEGGEQGKDVIADEVFRELVGKDKGKDPQEALDDAEQDDTKKVGDASTGSTIWTDVHRASRVDTSTKVRALHQHFDVNRDKHLCYSELSALQMATSGERLEGPEYCHLCREHQCDPRKGLTIKALQQVYEENGMGHLDDDYDEVFQGRDPKEVMPASMPQEPAVDAPSSSMYGFSLPELPSPSHLSNMLFGSGFGSSTIDQDSTNVASGEDADEDDDEAKEHHPGASVIEQGEENDNEESSGLLARIRSSPGRSKPAQIDEHVIALHRFFDVYKTGRLGYCELRNMQLRTANDGDDLTTEEYRMICEELDIDPREGLTAEALQQTYLSGGGNVRNDYKKIFPSESVAAMFSSPEGRSLGVNLHGDFPFLDAERLEKVALIFQYFDDDQTGLLSYRKLRKLQVKTSGEDMDGPQFSTVCSMYKCDPQDGITLENLRDIYSSQGVDSSLDDDYRKIYRKYVWSVSRKEMDKGDRDKESSDETKDIQTQEGLVEEDGAEISEKEGDESMQESGEGSMEKQTPPQISFV